MYPFWPDSPFTIAYALILGGALLFVLPFGDRSARLIGTVMLADWLGTRAATAWGGEATALIAACVDLSAAAALLFIPSLKARLIAGLFGAMLAFYSLKDAQLLGYEAMWAMVDLLAYLQIGIMVAAGIDGVRGQLDYRRSGGVRSLLRSLVGRRSAIPPQRYDFAPDHEADR